MCYYCRECDAYVGCHKNSRRALGTMADKPLRNLRVKVHRTLDPLWRSRKYSRQTVYDKLHEFFGFSVHVGASDDDMCYEILEALPYIFPKDIKKEPTSSSALALRTKVLPAGITPDVGGNATTDLAEEISQDHALSTDV